MEDIAAHIAGLGWGGRFRSVEPVCLKGFRYADLFKVVETDGTTFALKLRDAGRGHVAASLACLEAMDDAEGLFVRYAEVRSRDGLWFLLSPWIDGTQPVGDERAGLPDFFRQLGRFNRRNTVGEGITSMYLDGKTFPSVADLAMRELSDCLGTYRGRHGRDGLRERAGSLAEGLGSLICEDINTGNLVREVDGAWRIIDTEFLGRGINLYQFDHFDFWDRSEAPWYQFSAGAADCLAAYFGGAGIAAEAARSQIEAFALLQILRIAAYDAWAGRTTDWPAMDAGIDRILSGELGARLFSPGPA
jgi:hypothetical protein